jgi:uncharacterized protein (UPF0335 family)
MREIVGRDMVHVVCDGEMGRWVDKIEGLVVEARLGGEDMSWVFERLFGRGFEVKRRFTLVDLCLEFPELCGCVVGWRPAFEGMLFSLELVCVFYDGCRHVLDLVFLDGRRFFVCGVSFPADVGKFVRLCCEFLRLVGSVGDGFVKVGGLGCC